MILPKARQELFINMVENYKIFCPKIKLIYGGLNYNSEYKADYIVIFEANPENQKRLIVWDCPYIYTNRSLPGYRYAIKNNQYVDFFRECAMHFCQLEEDKFYEYLTSENCDNLSLDRRDERYWKNPDNIEDLIKGITTLSLRYAPSGFRNKNRPKEFG